MEIAIAILVSIGVEANVPGIGGIAGLSAMESEPLLSQLPQLLKLLYSDCATIIVSQSTK